MDIAFADYGRFNGRKGFEKRRKNKFGGM